MINASGQTAFQAFLTGAGVDGTNNSGVYSEGAGVLAEVARTGRQAPGSDPDVLFSLFFVPVINAPGQTAFLARLTGSNVGLIESGIYSDGAGVLSEVARQGRAAPGAEPGVVFSGTLTSPVLNDSGKTAFGAFLSGSGVDLTNNAGIYSEGSGALAEVARSGGQIPGADPGVVFAFSGRSLVVAPPVINESGQTAFQADLSGPGVIDFVSDTGFYSDASGALAEVAREGWQAPGADQGVVFSNFGFDSPVFNALGQTAFRALVTGPGVDETNNTAILSEGSGTLSVVARAGDQAPGADPGVVFIGTDGSFKTFSEPVINASGQTAFRAALTGVGVDFTNSSGIYSERSDGLTEVARKGQRPPGADSGIVFNGFSEPVINASGQTAFRGFLTGLGIDSSNDEGIYATDVNGVLLEVLREGAIFDVDDNPLIEDPRTVADFSLLDGNELLVMGSGNQDGRRSVFNDLGQIVFRAEFTDGSSGIFVSNVVAVPEPAAALLAALGLLAGLTRRRRH